VANTWVGRILCQGAQRWLLLWRIFKLRLGRLSKFWCVKLCPLPICLHSVVDNSTQNVHSAIQCTRRQQTLIFIVNRVRFGKAVVWIPVVARDFLFSKRPGALFRGTKWPEHEICRFSFSAEVKNEWSHTYFRLYAVIVYSDNFTFLWWTYIL